MREGFIKIQRKVLKWEWYSDLYTSRLFFHLLLIANFEDARWKGISVKRGQCIIGRKSLAVTLGISEQSIRTSLERLKSTNEVTIKPTNKYSVITLVNYETYNPVKVKGNQQSNQESNQQLTNNQPTTNHSKEEEEVKKKKNIMVIPNIFEINDYISQKGYCVSGNHFFEFYEAQNPPWSNNKGDLMRSWKATLTTWNNNAEKSKDTGYVSQADMNAGGQPGKVVL